MAGVMNHTAKQYNVKHVANGRRVVVRIAPGFNIINDDHWKILVPENGKMDDYVELLQDQKKISFGPEEDDLQLEQDPHVDEAQSKSDELPKQSNFRGGEAEDEAEAEAEDEVAKPKKARKRAVKKAPKG